MMKSKPADVLASVAEPTPIPGPDDQPGPGHDLPDLTEDEPPRDPDLVPPLVPNPTPIQEPVPKPIPVVPPTPPVLPAPVPAV